MIPSLPPTSEKLKIFFDCVRKETGREIVLQAVSTVGLPGMNFSFHRDPNRIIINIVLPFQGSPEEFENSIAHEAGHGYLEYGRGYKALEPIRKLDPSTKFSLSVVGTMIDDVPVNKLIEEHGFNPFSENYISMTKREAKAARRKDISIYRNTGPTEICQQRFMIYRYVASWAYLNYFEIDSQSKTALRKFRKNFKRAYPVLSNDASVIQSFFKKHDVFSSKGHENLMMEVLNLWGLNAFVMLSN